MLPPAVAGIGLLAAFGRLGLLGGSIEALGIDIAFTKAAVVLAVTFVASPFYVRTAVAAFESIDPTLPAAARTLGAGPGRVFLRVALPLAAGGPRGRGGARVRPRHRRVRGDDHVRRARSRGRRRRCRSRSTSSSTSTSTSRSRSAPCSSSSAPESCSPSSFSPDGAPDRLHPSPSRLRRPRRADRRARRDGRARRAVRAPERRPRSASSPASSDRGAGASPSATRHGWTRPPGSTARRSNDASGYLFQEYALFPHLDVSQNVRFGAPRGTSVTELLERFRISSLAGARVRELSGGERQRVALARALARRPETLLLDEPLSALDAHTKASVRSELHELLRELGLPTILVTHDFEDAAALADRIGVIVDGRVVQEGSAADLVARPLDGFVASLTGASLLRGSRTGQRLGSHGGRARRRRLGLEHARGDRARRARRLPVGGHARPRRRPTTRR